MIETFDCTSGGAQHCYGCYTMELCKEGYGDWIRKSELLERLRNIRAADTPLDELIAELSK